MMVPHQASAVAMAVVALARAGHPDVAELAPRALRYRDVDGRGSASWVGDRRGQARAAAVEDPAIYGLAQAIIDAHSARH